MTAPAVDSQAIGGRTRRRGSSTAAGARAQGARRLRLALLTRIAAVGAAVLVLNLALADRVTRLEAGAAVVLGRALGIGGVDAVSGTNLVRGVHGGSIYFVRVTDSCSSLTTSTALVGLSFAVLGGRLRSRLAAALLAVAVVTAGNLTRILAIVWWGNTRGVPQLVLFHDWVGTLYSLAYLLAGFLVLVAARLPRARRWLADPPPTFGL